MSHKDAIEQLWPIKPDNLSDNIQLPGAHYDKIRETLDALKEEMHPDTCVDTIMDWERIYGITPDPADTLQQRRDRVSAKCKATGGISPEYFTALAAAMGYTVTITAFQPFVCGGSVSGDMLGSDSIRCCWLVTIDAVGPEQGLEDIFNKLKHSRIGVEFEYTG